MPLAVFASDQEHCFSLKTLCGLFKIPVKLNFSSPIHMWQCPEFFKVPHASIPLESRDLTKKVPEYPMELSIPSALTQTGPPETFIESPETSSLQSSTREDLGPFFLTLKANTESHPLHFLILAGHFSPHLGQILKAKRASLVPDYSEYALGLLVLKELPSLLLDLVVFVLVYGGSREVVSVSSLAELSATLSVLAS